MAGGHMGHIVEHWDVLECDYCTAEIERDGWKADWDDSSDRYYKTLKCDGCGKHTRVRFNFFGSGHDTTLNREETPLESIVRKVREG